MECIYMRCICNYSRMKCRKGNKIFVVGANWMYEVASPTLLFSLNDIRILMWKTRKISSSWWFYLSRYRRRSSDISIGSGKYWYQSVSTTRLWYLVANITRANFNLIHNIFQLLVRLCRHAKCWRCYFGWKIVSTFQS